MTALQSSHASGSACCYFSSRRTVAPRPAVRSHSVTVSAILKERDDSSVSRRESFVALGASASALLLAASPAQAFLGIGETSENDTYIDDTKQVLGKVEGFLALEKDDPKRDDYVSELRTDINSWVAKYRRRGNFTGRPSFGVSYTILNALAGSFNSFGNNAPLPKKRLERINKELEDAKRLLARGR